MASLVPALQLTLVASLSTIGVSIVLWMLSRAAGLTREREWPAAAALVGSATVTLGWMTVLVWGLVAARFP